MAFNGTEGGLISLKEGAAMTAAYREAGINSIKGRFFGRDLLEELLAQEGCMGIRMYFGLDDESNMQLVLVGADSDEDDMLELILDNSVPCPTRCGSGNGLNGNA